jgi:hypothetical protein
VFASITTMLESHTMKSDPLSPEQHASIHAFAAAQLRDAAHRPKLSEQAHLSVKKVLGKDYIDATHPDLQKARAALGPQAFSTLRAALRDPRAFASELGIDAHDPRQVYAAKMYLKAAVAVRPMHLAPVNTRLGYEVKMTGDYAVEDIFPKHALLMQGDPVQKGNDHATPHPLDVVLQNTHFAVPTLRETTRDTSGTSGTSEVITYTPDREYIRHILHAGLQRLHADPHTHAVVDALAALMRTEKGNVIFSGSPTGVGNFGKKYGAVSNMRGSTQGAYMGHHTILCPTIANPYDGAPLPWALSTLAHEAQHMLFGRIVGHGASPVAPGSPEERALDEALVRDRAHHQTLDARAISPGAQRPHGSLTIGLEDDPAYFNGAAYDPENPRHQHTMRTEAIVRPLEAIAGGASAAEVEAVAPHLWRFIQDYGLPLFRDYADAARQKGRLGASTPRDIPAPAYTGEKVHVQRRAVASPTLLPVPVRPSGQATPTAGMPERARRAPRSHRGRRPSCPRRPSRRARSARCRLERWRPARRQPRCSGLRGWLRKR